MSGCAVSLKPFPRKSVYNVGGTTYMKLRLILIFSVCVNLALAGAYFMTKRVAPSTSAAPEAAATPAKTTMKSDRERRAQLTGTITTNDFHWASVESDDYREYIANLRAIGVPEETIRDIIIADVNKLYAGRLAALYPSPQDFKWWQTDDRSNRDVRRDRERKRRDLNEEKRALVKELLGVDLETEMAKWEGRPDDDAWRTGFLSPEKQQAVQAWQEKFREMERTAFAEMRENRGSPEARAKMLALRAQREAELAQILGPQDFQEYQLRNSGTARDMRDSLGSFSPSEDEFKKIFELRENFNSQFGFGRGGNDETAREQRRAAEQQLDQQLQATLGEQRYAEYKLTQDDRYREIYDFTSRLNLPKETAQSVYDIRQAVEQQRQQVMNNQGMSAEDRAATLAQMAQATKETLAQTLPQQAYDQYLKSDDARWLQTLTRTETRDGGGRRGGFGGFQGGAGGPGGPGGGAGRFYRGGR